MAYTRKLEAYIAGAWVDLSADVVGAVRGFGGIDGGGPGDRCAGGGQLSFAMNNSALNAAGLVGRYSPGHANCLAGWDISIKVRYSRERLGVRRYVFVGWIDDIDPAPGLYRDRLVRVTAVDLLALSAEWKVSGLETQINQRSDQIFTAIRDNLPISPESSSVGTGRSTFAYALDTSRDESMPVLAEFQRVAASEVGYVYIKGDTTAGGCLVFESRADRAARTTNLSTFNQTMAGLKVRRARDSVIKKIQVMTHPRRVDTSVVVLCALESKPTIGPGESYTWLAQYRDPQQKAARVGGTDMVTPVAATDYTFNGAADGTGTDLTSALSVVAEFGGNGVRFTLANTGAASGFVTKLQARGIGIYDFEQFIAEIDDVTADAATRTKVASLDMSYESDPRMGVYCAQYLAAVYDDDGLPLAETVSIVGDGDTLEAAIFDREIGDRIGLVESMTAIGLGSGTVERGYFIQRIEWQDGPAPAEIRATYTLAPAGRTRFWRIGIPGATAIGVGEALLGF
jgi:hypothetical protein